MYTVLHMNSFSLLDLNSLFQNWEKVPMDPLCESEIFIFESAD